MAIKSEREALVLAAIAEAAGKVACCSIENMKTVRETEYTSVASAGANAAMIAERVTAAMKKHLID